MASRDLSATPYSASNAPFSSDTAENDQENLPSSPDSEDPVRETYEEKNIAVTAGHHVDYPLSHEPSSSETPNKSWKAVLIKYGLMRPRKIHHANDTRPWRTTLIRFGPLSGLASMLVALGSLIASLGILAGSDGQPVASWSVAPSNYIAIFTAISNLSMRYAAIQGVVIAWWNKALKGSTLASLHWDWRSGTTLRGALTAGRHMGLLGLACIFSTLVVIDGPLLQRSTSIVSSSKSGNGFPINVTIAPEIPSLITGDWQDSYFGSPNKTVPFVDWFNGTMPSADGPVSNYINYGINTRISEIVGRQWLQDDPISGIVEGCSERCRAKIRAPALFPTSCTSYLSPINFYNGSTNAYDNFMNHGMAVPLDQDAFMIAMNLVFREGKETLNLITADSKIHNCAGDLNLTACTLESGIGEYDVEIYKDIVTLEPESAIRPTFISIANNTAVSHNMENGAYPSTLGGIAALGSQRWTTMGFWYPDGNMPALLFMGRIPSSEYMDNRRGEYCMSFRDPWEDVMQSLNTLMVHMGAHAIRGIHYPDGIEAAMDAGVSVNSKALAYPRGTVNVFKTEYWYFVGAAIVELVCIVLVAPTYWGWWKLGRSVSFSPLETAKAFESCAFFVECNSNSSGRDIANAVGDRRVRYGATVSGTGGQITKLAFDDLEAVSNPSNGSRFQI